MYHGNRNKAFTEPETKAKDDEGGSGQGHVSFLSRREFFGSLLEDLLPHFTDQNQ